MEVYYPANYNSSNLYPSIVFFFGGGWINGSITQFEHQALYFSTRGMFCFLPDYRVASRQNTTPFDCLKDAKSAMRFVREHAGTFHLDTTEIVASGGSAGGQLAAATALVNGFNEKSDNLSFSCRPDALILFNPVIDNGPGGYGYERIGEKYKDFSPLHNIHKGAPPTIIFQGTHDVHIPVPTAEYYKTVMEKVGSRCDLLLFKDQKHGFFNYANRDFYEKTLFDADTFLISLGYLKGKPTIENP